MKSVAEFKEQEGKLDDKIMKTISLCGDSFGHYVNKNGYHKAHELCQSINELKKEFVERS